MSDFWTRLRLGVVAFREAYLTSFVADTPSWDEQKARQMRYNVLWAQYDSTSYRDIQGWANAYRTQYAMYKFIRPIYNPAYRLGEFWKSHIFGGLLSPEADNTGAVPISTDNESLRPAIAELWKWSRWQVKKDILSVRGTILGDAAIQIVDDIDRGRVYMELLHPGDIKEVDLDPFGSVKSYTIEKMIPHPTKPTTTVRHTEIVSRSGDDVVYQTFLNDRPYAFNDDPAEWAVPYGFIPLVIIQHNDVGLGWGWSELHPIRAKVQEVDGLASQLSDHIRKTVDPIWIMKMKYSDITIPVTSPATDGTSPEPGREELQTIYTGKDGGGAEAMVADIDMESVLMHIDNVLKEIERDVVELSSDIHTASGSASGRALRTARQPIVAKALIRRNNYDAGLVSAQQMAVAIGGFRKYDGYSGFGLDSFGKGDLDHTITARKVFESDPLDDAEVTTAEWNAARAAVDAGVKLEGYLRSKGLSEEEIKVLIISEVNNAETI